MKLFCILIILVFVVVLGVYYSVMFACAYKKFDEKMKKSQKKSRQSRAVVIQYNQKGEGKPSVRRGKSHGRAERLPTPKEKENRKQ